MSKFDGILTAKTGVDTGKTKTKPKQPAEAKNIEQVKKKTVEKRIGKRSHPDFTQITAYIKKNTHEDVMRKIYKRQEFSELLEELLIEWLQKK
jgi:hypothetical protein